MALLRNGFEGYAVGATPTVGTSGGINGDAFTLVSFGGGSSGQIVDSPQLYQTRALRCFGAGGTALVEHSFASVTANQACQFYFATNSVPSGQYNLMLFRTTGGTNTVAINHTVNNTLRFSTFGGDWGVETPVLTNGEVYLIDYRWQKNASPTATNGIAEARVTRVSDETVLLYQLSGARNLGGSSDVLPTLARFGRTGSTFTMDVVIDSVSYDADTTQFIPVPQPPVVDTGLYVRVNGVWEMSQKTIRNGGNWL